MCSDSVADTCKHLRRIHTRQQTARAALQTAPPDFSNTRSNYASRQLARSFIFSNSREASRCKLHASTFNDFDCVHACNFPADVAIVDDASGATAPKKIVPSLCMHVRMCDQVSVRLTSRKGKEGKREGELSRVHKRACE